MSYSQSLASPAPSQSLLSHLAFVALEAAVSSYLPARWWLNYLEVVFPHGSHGYVYYCDYDGIVIDHALYHVPYFELFSAHHHPSHFHALLAAINIVVNRKKCLLFGRSGGESKVSQSFFFKVRKIKRFVDSKIVHITSVFFHSQVFLQLKDVNVLQFAQQFLFQ